MNTEEAHHHEHSVEARADAAEDHLADWMFVKRHEPADGVKLSCMPLTAPQEASVVTVAKSAVFATPKRTPWPRDCPSA